MTFCSSLGTLRFFLLSEQEKKPDDNTQDQPKDPAEELEALGEALEKTRELREKQQDLNARIGRAARNGRTGEINEKMANDSTIESFAIRVFCILVRRAKGEPETPTEQNAVKTL